MLSGRVNARLEPILSVTVRGPTGITRPVNALVDTGFSGPLMLPPSLIRVLALPWLNRDYAVLADGTIIWFEMSVADIHRNGGTGQVAVQAVDAQPLIGTGLMHGHDLMVRVTDGGSATIAANP